MKYLPLDVKQPNINQLIQQKAHVYNNMIFPYTTVCGDSTSSNPRQCYLHLVIYIYMTGTMTMSTLRNQ